MMKRQEFEVTLLKPPDIHSSYFIVPSSLLHPLFQLSKTEIWDFASAMTRGNQRS
jgi:hypothetical protein